MDILLYITELFQSHKAIGIVGLGTLYKKKSPGKYDTEKHAFVPPSYTLIFSKEVQEQEALASFIGEKRNITVDSANYYISEYVEQIHAQLAMQQEADLGSLGKLKLINNDIVLIPDQQSNFGFEFYGLPTLSELPSKHEAYNNVQVDHEQAFEETVTKTANEIIEDNKLAEENPGQETITNIQKTGLEIDEQLIYSETSEVEATRLVSEPVVNEFETVEKKAAIIPNSYTPNYEYDEEDKPNKTGKILLKLLIVLFIIGIGSAILYYFFPDLLERKVAHSPDNLPISAVTLPKDSVSLNLDSINLADSISKSNISSNSVKEKIRVDSVSVSTWTYEVIGSAERNQKRIDYVVSYMKKRGINAKPLKNVPGKLIKISLGSFTDFNLAKAYQDSLRVKLKNPQIYIQSIKPTP